MIWHSLKTALIQNPKDHQGPMGVFRPRIFFLWRRIYEKTFFFQLLKLILASIYVMALWLLNDLPYDLSKSKIFLWL